MQAADLPALLRIVSLSKGVVVRLDVGLSPNHEMRQPTIPSCAYLYAVVFGNDGSAASDCALRCSQIGRRLGSQLKSYPLVTRKGRQDCSKLWACPFSKRPQQRDGLCIENIWPGKKVLR